MLLKVFACLLLLTIIAPLSSAGPLDWVKHHKRFLLMEGAAVGAASIHAWGLHHCRKTNGVEPCDLHYGSAWAMFGVTTGMNIVVMPAVAESCWKDGQGKFCYAFAYGGSAAQGLWGWHEWEIRRKRENDSDSRALRLR